MTANRKKEFRRFLDPNMIIPLFTAIAAAVIVFLTFLIPNLMTINLPEQIIIALLALVAAGALIERSTLIRRIEAKIDIMRKHLGTRHPFVATEAEVIPFEDRLKHSTDLFISGGSLHGLLNRYQRTLIKWLKDPSHKATFIIVDPKEVSSGKMPVQSLHIQNNKADYLSYIRSSQKCLKSLKSVHDDQVRYYLSKQIPSMTVMIIDQSYARVSLNIYDASLDERPVIEITQSEDPEWFSLFWQRYHEDLVADSKIGRSK